FIILQILVLCIIPNSLSQDAFHPTLQRVGFPGRDRKRTKNLFGFQAYDRNPSGAKVFISYEEGIFFVAEYIRTRYATAGGAYYKGGTLKAMGSLWASDPQWTQKVCSVAATLRRRAQ
ncbi:MAG TPA: hypothetical protein PKL89_02035, partial [Coprothermobacter proteolyticus]|nr:hypothetical protein [Coprothermobacter proteolyticus]